MNQLLESAIERFDEANAEDPRTEMYEGAEHPQELVYAWRMSRWLEKLSPDASETLRLAARCQHICRWTIPREDYPMTRRGYLAWRSALARFHARKAGEILTEVGYDGETIARVQALIRKENLKSDPQAQLLEDVICLVFLESYFADFSKKHDDQKLLRILRKTAKKMSPHGRELAMTLQLAPGARELLKKAMTHDS